MYSKSFVILWHKHYEQDEQQLQSICSLILFFSLFRKLQYLMLFCPFVQFAIVFKTPAYWNVATERPVKVHIELRRKSDREKSEPVDFTYQPQMFGKIFDTTVAGQALEQHNCSKALLCVSVSS